MPLFSKMRKLAASVPILLAFLPWLLTYKFLWEKPFIKCLNKATAREKAIQAQKDGDSLYLCLLRRTSAVGDLPKPSGSKHLSRMGLEPELNKQHSRRRKKTEVWSSEFSESYLTFSNPVGLCLKPPLFLHCLFLLVCNIRVNDKHSLWKPLALNTLRFSLRKGALFYWQYFLFFFFYNK